ncbi:hypothetical protein BROUX41_000526 [Berkeleyomyces rouxiae]|uniref:uncharacterized protein n=1 Tax=Berkeleyomyces rouxiae TaxID=2035830 RepID=UPI003B78FEE6
MLLSFLFILVSATASQAGKFKGVSSDYSFDLAGASNPDWMSKLPDDASLPSLSIPGTHNSMGDMYGDSFFRFQNTELETQLEAGIRYLDFSVRVKYDILEISHASFLCDVGLGGALDVIFEFLDENPSETVILRLRKGYLRSGDDETFEKTMEKYLGTSGYLVSGVGEYVYYDRDGILSIPNLGQLRGKVLILQDFQTKTPGRFGIPWKSDSLAVTDRKLAIGGAGLSLKWLGVQSSLQAAHKETANKLHITHTSVSLGYTPAKAAGGKKTNKDGMNDRLGKYLDDGKIGRVGIVAMDFPGKQLVDQIIRLNDFFYPPTSP